MSRRKEPRGSVRHAMILKTCATCGEKGIAHTASGQPYQAHLRGRRHLEALERVRSEKAAADLPDVDAPDPVHEGDAHAPDALVRS